MSEASGSNISGYAFKEIESDNMDKEVILDKLDEHIYDAHLASAFAHSVMMVIATEIGDKTFFIAAVLAMSKNFLAVFLGAWGALASMTVLSAALGLVLPSLLDQV